MSLTTAPILPPRQIKLFLGPFPGMKKFDGQIGDEFHLILEYSLQNVLQIGHDLRPTIFHAIYQFLLVIGKRWFVLQN